ncbi:MerR family transcriptional regulator [Apilactobacillus ozensis]|uniref:Merr family transcriptional regulator n=1 Tax=Apilactobacillus ozensis DSM 23829 = JCM 17196 TaxID=1423781 RepID=A0A0R2APG3_9LACO|nr:MerR family transcriptional regulator [Apilactobacillus ozensis]KRM67636.1 merr family transcriptional regulator [Apilactobacillus ozensis DSM 23829 = JCM 17196]MCK8607146.1 MerR family transcriptional regulator [Apilactobacillus ozensis]
MNIEKVSQEFNLSKDTLRYWERIELLPPVQRNSSGYRDYTEQDLNWIFYVNSLRNAGMSIERLLDFVKSYRLQSSSNEYRKQLLIEQRQILKQEVENRQKTINYLSYKIEHFADHTLTYENEKLAYDKDNEEEK